MEKLKDIELEQVSGGYPGEPIAIKVEFCSNCGYIYKRWEEREGMTHASTKKLPFCTRCKSKNSIITCSEEKYNKLFGK